MHFVMLVQLTARALHGAPLADWAVAARLWRSLRRAFPDALSAMLMPNHPHLVLDSPDPDRSRVTLAGVLGALERRAPARGRTRAAPRWDHVPPAQPIADRQHLRRLIRYVALNPCRAGLVRDPLEWEWSTHRDVLGGVVDPWITAGRLAAVLGTSARGFAAAWHAYVSGDPTCDVAGTPVPTPACPTEAPIWSLGRIVAAAAAATRALTGAVRARGPTRRLFIQLAWTHGWCHRATLARACGITPQAVCQLRSGTEPQAITAGDLCLGDDRLLRRAARELEARARAARRG